MSGPRALSIHAGPRALRHLREHGLIAGTGNVLNLPQPHALQSVAGC